MHTRSMHTSPKTNLRSCFALWSISLWSIGLWGCSAAPPIIEPAPLADSQAVPEPPLLRGLELALHAPLQDSDPLIVVIHGLGSTPEDMVGLLQGYPGRALLALPRGPDPWHEGWSWFPAGATQQDPTQLSAHITSAAARLARYLQELHTRMPDRGKPIITGFSQGGMMSFAVAVLHPDSVSLAVPVAGWLPAPLWQEPDPAHPPPPIVAYHGDADPVLPLAPTQKSVAWLAAHGYDATLHTYKDVPHRTTSKMRADIVQQIHQHITAR